MKTIFDSSCVRFIWGMAVILLVASAVNWEAYKSGRVGMLLDNLEKPHSGEEEVLPGEVRSVLGVLRERGIRSITVSPAIAENRFIFQPLTESACPIIINSSSKIFVCYSSERLPAKCATIKVEKGLRIADCR